MARRGEARQRLKAPENRATSRAAPPGAEAPEGTRRRPAVVADRRPRLAGLIGGADEPRAPRRERPHAAVVKFGGVQPRPRGHSGKAWCRAALAETFRSARTCPCAGPQGLPERSEGPQRTGALAPEGRVGRPARKARPDPRKEGFSPTRRAIYRPKATTAEPAAQRFSAKSIQERHAEIMLHRRSYTHHLTFWRCV